MRTVSPPASSFLGPEMRIRNNRISITNSRMMIHQNSRSLTMWSPPSVLECRGTPQGRYTP